MKINRGNTVERGAVCQAPERGTADLSVQVVAVHRSETTAA